MDTSELYFCEKCGGYFDIGDGEHLNNEFVCHRCFYQRDCIHRTDVEYICEIAFCIGANGYKEDMDNILAEYTALDFDYECYVDFYKRILLSAERRNDGCTLLETIYEIVNNKKEFLDTRDIFLSTYKK